LKSPDFWALYPRHVWLIEIKDPDATPPPHHMGDEAREAARQRAFERMRAGINFGGEKFDRDEIYEERMRELEARQDRQR
jgi:hypothetical protein